MGKNGAVSGAVVVAGCWLLVHCGAPASRTSQTTAPQAAPVEAVNQPAAPQPSTPPQPPDRREVAKRGLAALAEKKYDEAIPLLNEAAAWYPEVAPFLRLRVSEAEAARGNHAEAAKIAAEIVALGETSAATVARLRLAGLYASLNDATSTDAAFRQAMAVPIDELTERDFVELAKALAKAGRNDLATSLRMRLLTDYTSGRYTEQTYDFVKEHVAQLPNPEKLALAQKLTRADRYDQALALFNQIPEGGADARAARMRALFASRNYGQLLEETKDVPLNDPALVLLRARAAWRDDKPQEMLGLLDRIEKEWPASAQAGEAKVIRAKYYVTDVVDHDRALENLNKAISAKTLGNDGENLWNLGFTYALQGKYDDALRTFDRYIAAYPDGDWKTNSLFWSAKIHERHGRVAERNAKAAQIVAEYPFSYYSYRVKELWGDAVLPAAASATAKPAARFPDLSLPSNPRFATVDILLDLGLNAAAMREMKLLAARYEDNPGVQFRLADVYVRGGEPFRANGVLQRRFRQFVRHGGEGIPQRFWEILYPLAYWETIQAEGARRGHDPYLLASIIRQESGFEPSTVSNAGAVGLMQIMPQEAPRIAEAAGLGSITRTDLFDPATNIAVGAAEYSQKLSLMNNNAVLAIAAYNAGESAVGTWLERTPLNDVDLFVETIPYAETRLYVKTVTRNRFEYRRIYEGSRTSPPESAATQ